MTTTTTVPLSTLPSGESSEELARSWRRLTRVRRRRRPSGRCRSARSISSISSRCLGCTRSTCSGPRTAARCSSTTRLSSAPDQSPHERLVAAKARLDRLDWWPTPVRIDGVRLSTARWFFRLPWLGRFDGYAFHRVILLRSDDVSDDLVTHELCHAVELPRHGVRKEPVRAAGARGGGRRARRRQARDQGVVRVTLLPDGSANDADPSRLSCPSAASDA